MTTGRGQRRNGWLRDVGAAAVGLVVVLSAGSCQSRSAPKTHDSSSALLRVGVGQVSSTSPTNGIRQLAQLLTVENLGRLGDDGRVTPWLAANWTLGNGNRTLVIELPAGVKFHDGSAVDAQTVVTLLPEPLRTVLGPLHEDVSVRATERGTIEMQFRRPSPLLLEALEVQVKKPGPANISTGPFLGGSGTTSLQVNAGYHLGRPKIDAVSIQPFPSVRNAWAELLRNRIDFLYDVGADAFDSLQSATNVAVFTYVRHYQYALVLNTELPALRPAAVRRALNVAVNRNELVRRALSDRGVASSGVIWPKYWALPEGTQPIAYDPSRAAETLKGKSLKFTCLVAPDQAFERIALELKHQLATVGIEMTVRAAALDEIFEAERTRNYDAVLVEVISAPTLLRPYQLWHSKGAGNPGTFGTRTIDTAFDRLREADTEAVYRQAVAGLHQAFLDDPPAVFLAWSERARAVSKRFTVPELQPGRDVLATIRLWAPRTDERIASRN